MSDRDWFTPYLPVPDPSTEVDEFAYTVRTEPVVHEETP